MLYFALALLPIAWLVVALVVLKLPAHVACAAALAVASLLALTWWRLDPALVATAALEGALNALWPICLVIVAALFAYNLTVRTGAMEQIKRMLVSVSPDKRVLALLIAWGFGNFMEGMAGFGTAVAIPAAMLVGIGFNPLAAVVGCLVVNSTPTAFGSVGVPTVTLASVAGVDLLPLCADVVLVQCALTFVSPLFLVCICGGGLRALRGVLPLTLAASVSFVVPWFACACLLGPELPDVLGAVCSMACIVALARLRARRGQADPAYALAPSAPAAEKPRASAGTPAKTLPVEAQALPTLPQALRAWSPFALILALLMLTSTLCPPIHDALAVFKSQVQVYAGPNPNTLTFSWVNTPGVVIFVAAVAGGLIQGASPRVLLEVLLQTLRAYWRTVLTICCVMAMAKVMGYSGMIAAVAAVLVAATGSLYPFVAPLIGALGAFVTGSGTSTNVLFGSLQAQTAAALGLNPSWMAAANVMGAGIGKMICPQGIAIGASAAGLTGEERSVMAGVLPYFAAYVLLAGALCMAGSLLGA